MSDKMKKVVNEVRLSGKVAEIEVNTGETKKKKIPYVSIKGAIQFGEDKVHTRRFETYVQEQKSDGGENKLYEPTLTWAKSAKSIVKVGFDEATLVEVQGAFETNDYVNSEDKLVESLNVSGKFFNDFDVNKGYKGIADVEGYIQSINEETKGEDQTETGRLRVNVITSDFFGNVIPVKNIIVPKELHDDFLDGYEVGQSAIFYIDFIANKSAPKPKKTGGLGVQRETDGKSYIEMILTGASPAVDEDDDNGISKEAIKIGLSERKAKLNELVEKGYQGSGKKNRNTIGSSSKSTNKMKPKAAKDEDIPF